MIENQYIRAYLDLVRSGVTEVCREQILLADLIEHTFATEELHVDEEQLERYMGLQRYFPYELLPWEKFLFALHNCVYTAEGDLRWPVLVVVVGRGAGKNGYLAFEDFALITPINGIPNYDIDIFVTSEEQASATFFDIWHILEGNPTYFSRYYEWTKEEIRNKKTGSRIRFHTSSARTKDGGRPGKVDFDEVHAYLNYELLNVAITGLGKKPHPRQTYITTMGKVRGGPLDRTVERAEKVLAGEIPDDGWLYFICRLDSDEEILDPRRWGKANPSLYHPSYRSLLKQLHMEFALYKLDPNGNLDFAVKRMNRIMGDKEFEVTSWDNILAASRALPDQSVLQGRPAVAGLDYASTQDFVAAGILFLVDDEYVWLTHTWVCSQSSSLARIQFPLAEAEARGELTMVDLAEIPPEMPVQWIWEMAQKYKILMVGIDNYRHTLMRKALVAKGFVDDRKNGNVKLVYSPEQSKVAPVIASMFLNHRIVWGDSMMMRWYTNNAIRILDKKGNITFGKIEPKSRKTDGFMALVAAIVVAELRQDDLIYSNTGNDLPEVFVF